MHRDAAGVDGRDARGRNYYRFFARVFADVLEEGGLACSCFSGQKNMPRRVIDEVRGCAEERVVVMHSPSIYYSRPYIKRAKRQAKMQGKDKFKQDDTTFRLHLNLHSTSIQPAFNSSLKQFPREKSDLTQLLFDADQLIVLRHPIRAGSRSCLDLTGVQRYCQVCNRAVFRFAGAM